jgi:hypothetical protein
MYPLIKVEDFRNQMNNYRAFLFLAANYCRAFYGELFDAELWDIETIDEFDYVLAGIYNQTELNKQPHIAVNFTSGRRRKFRGYLFTNLIIFRSITFK